MPLSSRPYLVVAGLGALIVLSPGCLAKRHDHRLDLRKVPVTGDVGHHVHVATHQKDERLIHPPTVAARQRGPAAAGRRSRVLRFPFLHDVPRGGSQDNQVEEEISLDEKVRRAMIKLGLTPPEEADDDQEAKQDCSGNVCEVPTKGEASQDRHQTEVDGTGTESSSPGAAAVEAAVTRAAESEAAANAAQQDADAMAARIAAEFEVDESLAMAAIGATRRGGERLSFDEDAARELIRQELDRIDQVSEGSPAVQTLVKEGFDSFLSRRALAFADMDLDDARAILLADQMDQEEDAATSHEGEAAGGELDQPKPEPLKTVTVKSDFDPTSIQQHQPQTQSAPAGGAPRPARKEDVVFEATGAQIQELVLESPVPVLLDCYADWCGPCKALGPILEEMATKGGGAFRLVKINTDNERAVSAALEVTALPTIFGIRDGKILNMFQGMPRSEKAMQSFMMGLIVGESNFDPPLSEEEKKKYRALTLKLVKMGGAASFSFSARERLQDRVRARLEELQQQAGDFVDAEESTIVLRSLFSNVIKDPFEPKFRTVNLRNKKIAKAIAQYPASMAILKSVGFRPTSEGDSDSLMLKKKVINVAPLLVARDCIDKWTDQSRHEVAKAARKRKDEEDRARLQREAAERGDEDEEEEEEEEEEAVDDVSNMCSLKLRMKGKNRIHAVSLGGDEPLRHVLKHLPVSVEKGQEVQITCVAKRLVAKSTDKGIMMKSFRELGLTPSASIVVAVGGSGSSGEEEAGTDGSSSLSQRVAKQKRKKKGSHTMQSVGIYAKDDNAKAELIDGGGGVWYEHDVTDDEAEAEKDAENEGGKAEDADRNLDDGYDVEDEDTS